MQGIIRTSLRLPADLYRRLSVAAKGNGRTMHKEIIMRLSSSFEGGEKSKIIKTPWGGKVTI